MNNKIELDFILPLYNPEPGWDNFVIETLDYLNKQLPNINLNLIIVNDGSQGTLGQAKEKIGKEFGHFNWHDVPTNQGKGAAIRQGLRIATSEFQIFTDHDLPYSKKSMIEMIKVITSDKNDVIIGVRGPGYYQNLSLFRSTISLWLKWFNRIVLRLPYFDSQGGLKAMNVNGKNSFLKTTSTGFAADVEFLLICHRLGLNICQLSVNTRTGILPSRIKISKLYSELKDLFRVCFRR